MNIKQYISRIRRGFNYIYSSILIYIHEKVYVNTEVSSDRRIKYIITPPISHSSRSLVVVFPACAKKAKYNYMRTLKDVDCWRIFIKDDFGADRKGNYLVETETEKLVIKLLEEIIQKHQFAHLFFVGSSKGGYEAINFSLHFPDVNVVVGAPQYYLADYLLSCDSIDSLNDIIGKDHKPELLANLNNRLKQKILLSAISPKRIYLHYSTMEHTYNEHIKDMIEDIKQRGIALCEDVETYPNHGDLINYFPKYLKETIVSAL